MDKKQRIEHATFTIEREFAATPAQVFAAWADLAVKAQWFAGPEEWERGEHTLDFRVGGKEENSGGPNEGPKHRFEATYWDIVENERIIYAYDMHLDDIRISVSLATVELEPSPGGTRMRFTEQAVYLGLADGPDGREEGTRAALNQLAAVLEAA